MEVFDTRQLRALKALAETQSFTAAAERLYLTQSAVSHSIKALEQTAGCRLVDRLGKKILLTRAGEVLFEHANVILDEMRTATEKLNELNAPGRGRLRIGASVTTCKYVLPRVLREFKGSFPNYDVSVSTGDTRLLLDLLESGELDLALTLQLTKEARLDFRELFTDDLGFVMSPLHPLAKRKRLDSTSFANETFIFYSRTSETFRLVEKYFTEQEIPMKASMELGSMAAIVEMAKIGLGIGIVAPWTALPELEDRSLVFHPARSQSMHRRWGIYMNAKKKEGGVAEDMFAGICKNVCDTIGARERLVLDGETKRKEAVS